ncbi:sensor histidine kinase [Alsobacter metallidurans]|nr:sensor histidine kinase [Alsobacter metallidurans]
MRPSFRFVFASAVALVALAATAALAIVVSRDTAARLEGEIKGGLSELASYMTGALDRGMAERLRDIRVAASLDTMRSADAPVEAKRKVLDQLKTTYPAYAAIALMSPEGRVVTATVPQMVGADVTNREFFQEGRKAPYVGDVHDALLLAKLMSTGPLDVPRFVDLVAPVRDDNGALVGVIGAHMFWSWAAEIDATLRSIASARHPGLEVFILAKDGTVLLGPDALRNKPVPIALAGLGPQSATVTWPDGRSYLTAWRRTSGYADYPGLGWTVLTRQPAATAFAPVADLQRSIAVAGLLVGLASALLAWFAAGWALLPLSRIRAYSAALGGEGAPPPPRSRIAEIADISDALQGASVRLQAHNAAQQSMIAELNHRVKNTLSIVQSITSLSARAYQSVAECTRRLQDRLHAIAQAHDVLSDNNWQAVDLRAIIERELRRYPAEHDAVTLDGPRIELTPQAAVMIGLAVHELAHNAERFGALSTPQGRIAVSWFVAQAVSQDGIDITMRWIESGGPRIQPPERRGLGSILLERAAAIGPRGAVAVEYLPDGIRCEMRLHLFHVPRPMFSPGAQPHAAAAPDGAAI